MGVVRAAVRSRGRGASHASPPLGRTSHRDVGPSRLEEKRGETRNLARNVLSSHRTQSCTHNATSLLPARHAAMSADDAAWIAAQQARVRQRKSLPPSPNTRTRLADAVEFATRAPARPPAHLTPARRAPIVRLKLPARMSKIACARSCASLACCAPSTAPPERRAACAQPSAYSAAVAASSDGLSSHSGRFTCDLASGGCGRPRPPRALVT